MKSDYKIANKTVKMDIQVEENVIEVLNQMAKFSKHSTSELVNTALKRFISAHKDFLPPELRDKIFQA